MKRFQFIMETINNLSIPMLSIDEDLYITQHNLSKMLGVEQKTLRNTFNNRVDEFDGVRAHSMGANDFIRENKHLLGVKRVRDDMHLWTEDDMITFAMLVRGKKGLLIRKELKAAIKSNAKRQTVSQEKYDELVSQLATLREEVCQLSQIKEEFELARPFLEEIASMAGKTLQAQRGTKPLRN